MESTFRRLMTAIQAEREQVGISRQQANQERDGTAGELKRLKHETQEWCKSEKAKIESEWRRLDKLSERMGRLWCDPSDIVQINCSGEEFTVPRSTLRGIEGSNLSQMFSDEFIHNIPRDPQGRLYLDFNPQCFSIVVDYLRNRRLRPDAPVPTVPSKHQLSMDLLAEALHLTPFMNENQVSSVHSTSLLVTGNMVQAMHPGWQVISSTSPLSLAKSSYFEVTILDNPNSSGGLAIGVCGHIPSGDEIHSIRLADSILYNSHNGLVGDCLEADDVEKGLQLRQGDKLGIRNEISKNCLIWYLNYQPIGTSIIRPECVERMRAMYPVFALYAPDTRIQVDFKPMDPQKSAADLAAAAEAAEAEDY